MMKKFIITSLSVLIAGFYASAQVSCQAGWTSNATPASSIVTFSDQSQVGGAPSTAATIYSWDFGDGNQITNTWGNTTHSYSQAGRYYVCLDITVVDSSNVIGPVLCTSSWCDSVIVGAPSPVCAAYFGIDSALTLSSTGSAYIYNYSYATPSGAVNSLVYTWDFGDGNTSNQPFPTHVYQSSGWYVICLTIQVTNVQGDSCSSTFCDTLGVDSLGNILFKTNGPGFTLNVLDPAAPVSISENDLDDLSIYPNPAANRVTIEAKGLRGTVNWSVRDMRGAVVMSGADAVNLGSTTIDVAELTEGFYVLSIESGKTVHNQKLQIRR